MNKLNREKVSNKIEELSLVIINKQNNYKIVQLKKYKLNYKKHKN